MTLEVCDIVKHKLNTVFCLYPIRPMER